MEASLERNKWVRAVVKKILLILLAFFFLFTAANVSAQSNSDCSTCHSFPDPSDGYIYDPPVIFINVPLFVDLDTEFTIEAGIDFNEYEIKELTLTIAQDQQILDFEKTTIKSAGMDKRTVFTFKATTLKLGVAKLSITANAMVYFDHAAGDGDDYRRESIVKYALISVGPTYLEPSSWSVLLNENGEKITLTAVEDITDLRIVAPSSLTASPTEKNSLGKGSKLSVSLSPKADEKIDDNIIVTWKQEGTPYALTIGVIHNPVTEGETDYHSWVGRITGISSIILLLLSLILGGMWNTKGLLNRLIKSATRIKFHCAVSWFLFSLALYHGLTLLISPYSQKLWNPWIILGEIGAIAMIVVSLTGSFMKFTIKLMGARKWRGFHLFATFAAMVLGTIHSIRLGTDLAFIRDNAILSKVILALLIIAVVLSLFLYIFKGKKGKKKAADDRHVSPTEEPSPNERDAPAAKREQTMDYNGKPEEQYMVPIEDLPDIYDGYPQDDYNWNSSGSSDYYADDYHDDPDYNYEQAQADYYGDAPQDDYVREPESENERRNDLIDYSNEGRVWPDWPESEAPEERPRKKVVRKRTVRKRRA